MVPQGQSGSDLPLSFFRKAAYNTKVQKKVFDFFFPLQIPELFGGKKNQTKTKPTKKENLKGNSIVLVLLPLGSTVKDRIKL